MSPTTKSIATIAGLFLVFGASACGGAASPSSAESGMDVSSRGETAGGSAEPMMVMLTPEDQEFVGAFDDDLAQLESTFGEAMSLGEVDCDAAASLKDSICELAGRICEISERHPDDPSISDKCVTGQERCERATSDVSQSCDA